MGRLPLDRVPRRRRGRDRQPQGAADDPLLPGGRAGGQEQLPAARGDRRRDRRRRRRRPGLLGAAAAHPPGREPRRRGSPAETPASFIAFDLLALGDDDLTGEPFADRRAALERALADAAPPIHVTPITRDEAIARAWFERFEGAGLDGLIAKRADLTYQPDKRVMTKIKHVRTADCVVAGYRVHKSAADAIGSLLLGLYVDDAAPPSQWHDRTSGLAPVGVIGAFPMARRRELFAELQPLVVDVAEHPWSWAAEMGHAPGGRQPLEPQEGPVVRAAAARSGSSRCATTTSRAPASGTRRSSCAGARTATRPPAATRSSSSRRRSTSRDVLAGRLDL